MKIGICTSLENIKKVEDMGFDYIEPAVVEINQLQKEKFQQVVQLVDGCSIKCEAFNVLFPGDIRLTGPEMDGKRIKEYLESAFARVSRLGAGVIVLGSGGARKIPNGWDREKAWVQLKEVAGIVGDAASRYNLTIAMEPLNTKETNILNSVEEGFKFAQEVKHPNIKLLADFYHMRKENETMDILVEAGSVLAHLHIANSNGRVYPLKRTEDIYYDFFSALKEAGYKYRVSIEASTKDIEKDGPIALKLLRELAK